MAFESKYTGKQVEELLGKISTIPTKTSQLENDSDYINSERLPCFLDNYAPKDFSNLPIDNITLYWDNGILKAKVGNGESGGGGGSTDYGCLWELKQDAQGRAYIYSNLPVVTQYGITMYADMGSINLPSLYDGLPIDNSTIYWEETLDDKGNIIKVLKAKGGIDIDGTLDDYLFDYLTDNNYAQKSDLPNMSLYVTNDTFNNTIDSLDFVDFNTYETINAIKNFKEGIEINGLGIYNIKDDIIYINSNVAIKGGLTTYADAGDIDLPSLYAGIPVDGATITKKEDGTLMLNPNLELGGLDETALQKYLDDYKYAKLSDIPSLDGYAKITDVDNRINDLVNGAPAAYDTLKEIADVLQGNVNSIGDIITTLGTKADKTYVDTELAKYIPIAGDTEVTGIKNFLNGLKIGGLPISKYEGHDDVIYIDANVVLRGGLTQYAVDPVTIPSIIESLPQAGYESKGVASFSSEFFAIDANGKVSIIPDSVGLNEEELEAWLANSDYATKTYVSGQLKNYALQSALTATNNTLATKWTQDNDKIANWDTAYGWGNHASAGYFLASNFTKANIVAKLGISDWALAATKPSYTTKEVTEDTNLYFTNQRAIDALTDTLKAYVTLKGTQTIEGEKNFTGGLKVNGSPIVYDSENGYWLLQGNLLITGGLTQYVDDGSVDLPNLYDGLPIDGTTIYWEETANGKLLKAKYTEGSLTAITKDMVIEALGYTPYDASNPNGYITSAALNGYATQTWVNQQGFLTEHQDLSGYQPKITSSAKLAASLVSGLATVATSGSYNDLSNKPTIPTNTNQLTNGAGFITSSALSSYLPLSGGTLTGDLILQSSTDSGSTPKLYFQRGVKNDDYYDYHIYDTGGELLIGYTDKNGSHELVNITHESFRPNKDNTYILGHNSYKWANLYTTLINGGIPIHSGNYSSYALPLSGGTIDGALIINRNPSVIFFKRSGATLGSIGFNGDLNPIIYNAASNAAYNLWHSGNSNLSSVDWNASKLILNTTNTTDWNVAIRSSTIQLLRTGNTAGNGPHTYSSGISIMTSYTGFQLASYGGDWNDLYFRSIQDNSTWLPWRTVAFTDSNVASATKLQTARKIWGQDFNGTGDITGQLNITGSLTGGMTQGAGALCIGYLTGGHLMIDTNDIQAKSNGTTPTTLYINDWGGNVVFCSTSGNVGIGTTSPSVKLDVRGTIQSYNPSTNGYALNMESTDSTNNWIFYQMKNRSYQWHIGVVSTHTNTNKIDDGSFEIRGNGGDDNNGIFIRYKTSSYGKLVVANSQNTESSIGYFAPSVNSTYPVWTVGTGIGGTATFGWYYTNIGAKMVLDTSGNLLAYGGITQYSDIRKKTKLQDVELTLSQVANAPLIEHYYNSDDKKTTHVGSIAQYWAEMNDWFCKLDNDGYYTMEIQNAALASAISVARELERYESKTDKKIRMLKKRINELEDEIEKLKSA